MRFPAIASLHNLMNVYSRSSGCPVEMIQVCTWMPRRQRQVDSMCYYRMRGLMWNRHIGHCETLRCKMAACSNFSQRVGRYNPREYSCSDSDTKGEVYVLLKIDLVSMRQTSSGFNHASGNRRLILTSTPTIKPCATLFPLIWLYKTLYWHNQPPRQRQQHSISRFQTDSDWSQGCSHRLFYYSQALDF